MAVPASLSYTEQVKISEPVTGLIDFIPRYVDIFLYRREP